ncbi:MAG: hypothetical protein RLZZ429_1772 [Bacteroidota bacterium]|jgi:hypothetical protein
MLNANLRLSSEERQLLLDEGFILTKRSILAKTEKLFGDLSEVFRQQVLAQKMNNADFMQLTPKLARGENYNGLPWVMMDYPRLFTKTDICAIRCFFWWGHYCSITLHLSGHYQERYQTRLFDFLKDDKESEWMFSVAKDPWQHMISHENYHPGDQVDHFLEAWRSSPYLKIAKKIPLTQWDQLDDFFTDNYAVLLSLLRG